jgi:hypothetical protein
MTLYLLDTNVISETIKDTPSPDAMRFMRLNQDTCLSAITFLEIAYGLRRMPTGRGQRNLEGWLDGLREAFQGRIVDVTEPVASRAGELRARSVQNKHNLTIADSLIASSAQLSDAVLVTRNTKDFVHCDVRVINPWAL